jgi:ATP-binding cassette subfamily B protein
MSGPYLTKITIDYAYANRDLVLFNALIAIGLMVQAFSRLISIVQGYLNLYVNSRIELALRSSFYKHLQKLSLRFFQNRSTGELMYRLDSDINDAVSLITDTFPSILLSSLRVIMLLLITLWLNWQLTLIVIAVVPIFYFHAHYRQKKI